MCVCVCVLCVCARARVCHRIKFEISCMLKLMLHASTRCCTYVDLLYFWYVCVCPVIFWTSSLLLQDRVEIVNQAESVINDIERNMAEYKDQLPTEEADKLRDSIANLRQTLANPDEATPEAIRESTGELQKSALKLFEIAYKSKVRMYVCMCFIATCIHALEICCQLWLTRTSNSVVGPTVITAFSHFLLLLPALVQQYVSGSVYLGKAVLFSCLVPHLYW